MTTNFDQAREERIQMLAALMRVAMVAGEREEATRLHSEFKAAVLARSTEQVRPMEKRMGVSHA
ncbi:TPA: hypothetical protein UM349_000463 [Stenotrophomonas maltophilia]|nr:hypothetical protein [Stenotrophomonas maltophilia]